MNPCFKCKHYYYDRMEIVRAVVGRGHKVKYKPQHYFYCNKGHKLESECEDFEEDIKENKE